MTQPTALARLAALCGIATEYHDIWGNRHATAPATERALLAAMHIPLDGDLDALADEIETRDWRRPLPPVQVLRLSDSPPCVSVTVDAADAQQNWRWILTLENGERSDGEFRPGELGQIAERRCGKQLFVRYALPLPALQTTGYHQLELSPSGAQDSRTERMTLIAVPSACYQPEAVRDEGRVWGMALQLYGVRSRRNWGIGDFSDLRALTDIAADVGAGIVGVNPLHALYPHNPRHCSPYSPSSRLFLNVLYIDVEAVPDCRESPEVQDILNAPNFRARLRLLRESEMVEYREVAAAKMEALELAYLHFRDHHLNRETERGRAFSQFRAEQGAAVENHALFEALQAHFHERDASVWGWPAWPEAFQDPASPAVKEFAAGNTALIGLFIYLQWLADQQLSAVGWRALQHGLGVGLYQDLALGVDPGGAEAWANQDVYAVAAHAGAPPDEYNLFGQDWGLPPFIPQRLREMAYAPFVATLRANMRHCGALRIDHVMSLMRLYWVPVGSPASAGAYVSYPLDDLLGILVLESQRNRCMIIGEDLGTVPDALRPALAELGVLSYRPFFFERSDTGSFKPPAEYARQALVAVSTHDLPTLRGFWKGTDLDTRAALGLFPTEEIRENIVVARAQDHARLLMALQRESLLPEGISDHPVVVPDMTPPLAIAVHTYLARTPAQVMAIQPEDVFGVIEQVNLPGSNEYPNWQRKLPLDIEDWLADERMRALAETMYRERGSSVAPCPEETGCAATIPRATYRLQFNRDFTLAQATELVPYLAELGVSHCYASPYLQARPGSSHGYDIVDHNAINPEIGSMDALDRFVQTLRNHGMGHILDMVPNHMGVMGSDNSWWLDVLENGQTSAYAGYFDIDWHPLNPELRDKVLLPLLGDHYGTVLSSGELKLVFDAVRGEFSLFYYQHRLPVDPASYPCIIGHRMDSLSAVLDANDTNHMQLESLLTAFGHLPPHTDDGVQKMAERNRDKEMHKRQLATLCAACTDIVSHIESNVAEFNGGPAEPASYDLLHELIKVQAYRLAYWRVASDEINYRRFFDINDLAALRMENPQVFEDTHRLVLDLVQQGKVDGLRIDHPDGLYDPGHYFHRLQNRALGRGNGMEMPDDRDAAQQARPLYLVIEKILAEHERIPDDWPIHGATGYRFANLANALFIDPGSEKRMTRIYADFFGKKIDFDELVYQSKKLIIRSALAGELNVLGNRLVRIAAASRYTCDFTLNSLRATLAEVVACFPVYRSYLAHDCISADDRRHIEWAVAVAKRRSPEADVSIFDFVSAVLTTDIVEGKNPDYHNQVWSFAMRLQQYTAPVMAKGLEDTSFYRYNRLVSLNDVGGEPNRFGITLPAFHTATRQRAERWPHNMLATSTHDSKRSEDVRARINVLSEIPDVWEKSLRRWSRLNRSKRILCDGQMAPTRNDEYLLYQTLLGTWPLQAPDDAQLTDYCTRIQDYMVKAVRESKENSSWIKVNGEYEKALTSFVQALLTPGENNLFLADFVPLAQHISRFGLLNSLSQTLLKLTVPGVPDIYQGCELWQFNLVDPDNRRPVDYSLRRQMLAGLQAQFAGATAAWPEQLRVLLDNMEDGRIKLYLSWRALQLRRRWPELFRDGEYLPLNVAGARAEHVCAYTRRHLDQTVIVVAPRFFAKMQETTGMGNDPWLDTRIELEGMGGDKWYDLLSGEQLAAMSDRGVSHLSLNRLLGHFPLALLANAPE